jgi:hypothetical protein
MRRMSPSCLLFFLALVAPGPQGIAAAPSQKAAAEVALSEGLLAFLSGEDAAAAERLGEAAALDPDAGTPRYWRGLALLRLGRASEAAAEIETSLAARHPPEVDRQRVLADLEAARREGSSAVAPPEWQPARLAIDDRGLWEGEAGLTAAADSNPNLFSETLSLLPPGGTGGPIRGEEPDESALLGLRLGIYPWHAREGPNVGAALEVRRSFHRDFGFLDLGEARGTLQAAFGQDPRGYLEGPLGPARVPIGGGRLALLVQAGGGSRQLDGASYLRTLDGAVALVVREAPATATRFDLVYSDREFSRGDLSDPRRSGEDLSLQVSQLFYFGRWDRNLRLGARWLDRQAGAPFAATAREGNAGLAWPIAQRWTVLLEGSVREDEYDRRESNLFNPVGERRSDSTSRAAATVTWAATDRLRWTLQGAYARRSSNVGLGAGLPDLDYRRTVVSVGVGWVF